MLEDRIDRDYPPNFSGQQIVKDFYGMDGVECFYKFFPHTIFGHVAQQICILYSVQVIHIYAFPAHSRVHRWKDVNFVDVKVSGAAEIAVGQCNKSELFSYFDIKFWLTQAPGFRQLSTKNKYYKIISTF